MPRKTYRVPAGRVVGLKELRNRMATANDLAYHLELTSDTADFAAVMEALNECYWIAAALATSTTRTGCNDHPQGPVDPEAPEGWGVCLLCNSRRRVGMTKARELTGQNLTGATSGINRPRRSVEDARRPSSPEAAAWREPEGQHLAELEASRGPVRTITPADRTHAAAIRRARADRAARAKEGNGS